MASCRREEERETVGADDASAAVFFCDGGLLPMTLPLPLPLPLEGAAIAPGPSALAASTASFNELLSRLVTSVAMGGDARRGSMRLELGGRGVRGSSSSSSSSASASQGSLLVHAEGDEVEIEIQAPPGVDTAALERNVQARLAQKGVRVTRFDVT